MNTNNTDKKDERIIRATTQLRNRKKELLKELEKIEKLFSINNQKLIDQKNFQKFKQGYLYYGQFEIDQLEQKELKKLQEKIQESVLNKRKKEKILQLISFKIENFE